MSPVELASITEATEDFNEQIHSFFLRSPTDHEGLAGLDSHRKQVFGDLSKQFSLYTDLISSYPAYGATAFVGMVKFEEKVDEVFESILKDGSLLMDHSLEDFRPHIKIEAGAVDLARQIISLDENIFMMIAILLWSANKQIPALQKLGKKGGTEDE